MYEYAKRELECRYMSKVDTVDNNLFVAVLVAKRLAKKYIFCVSINETFQEIE